MKAPRALAGWWAVATKEGRATLASLRFIIITALLVLAVLAGTYSIAPGAGTGDTDRVAYGFTYWPELNRSRPAMGLFVTSPGGEPLSGVDVRLVEVSGADRATLEVNATVSGWARFENLTARYPDRELWVLLGDESPPYASVQTTTGPPDVPREYEGLISARFVALGLPDRRVLSLVFIDSRGDSIEGADVFLWESDRPIGPGVMPPGGWDPYLNGTTNADGYYNRQEPLASGGYVIRAASGALNATAFLSFPPGPDPLASGPDGVLAFVGAAFLSFLLPIMALVVAYDAIARERSEGSLDLLLSKPVGRLGVAFGKLIGTFGSMALPAVIVLTGSALVIWLQSGSGPTTAFMIAFLGVALFLLLSYTLVFLAVSAHMKNMGTALLFSILLFLLFTFFWGLVSLLLAGLFAPPGSPRWFEVRVAVSLLTPTGVFQQWLTLIAPALVGGFFGPIAGTAALLPPESTAVAALAWTAGPLALFLWTVKYRLGEN